MLDTMNFGAFKTGYGSGQRRESAIFAMDIRPGRPLRDRISGVEAICNIPGDRWGVVNGILTKIPAYKAAVLDDGLRVCPALTQSTLYSEDLTNAVWTAARCSMALYDTFQGCNVHKLTENTDSNIQHYLRQVCFTSISDESVVGLCFIVKRQGRDAVTVQATTKAGSYIPGIRINLINGSVAYAGGFTRYSVTSIGSEFYRIFIAYNVGTGASTPFFFIAPVNGAGVSVYTGDGVSGILLGQISHVDFGVSGTPFVPPYIPNQTSGRISVVSETATSTLGTSFPLSNPLLAMAKKSLQGPNAQGHLKVTFKSNFNSDWLAPEVVTSVNLWTANNSDFSGALRVRKGGGLFDLRITDPVNNFAVVSQSPIAIGQIFTIILDWGFHPSGGLKMRLTVNDVQSSLSPFCGSFGTKNLCIGFGNTIDAFRLQDCVLYDRPRW